jgi:hypothetical protein
MTFIVALDTYGGVIQCILHGILAVESLNSGCGQQTDSFMLAMDHG